MKESSFLRKFLWPIEGYENKKFLPLAAMMFCILFNYSAVRSMKDGFVVTGMGAEAISFLKTYCVMPAAVIIMLVYTKLCNVFSQKKLFYIFASFFNIFFIVFAFVLYPNTSILHPSPDHIDELIRTLPNLKWFLKISGNWTYAIFYVLSDLYGAVMLSLLFWQFANQVTKTDEAKRFYSMFGLLGNMALPFFTLVAHIFLSENLINVDSKIKSIQGEVNVLSVVITSGFIIIGLFHWMNKNVLTDPRLYDPEEASGPKKKKPALSFGASIKMILSSKYIGLMTTLVLCYGVSINLVEGVWKSTLKELYPTKEAYTMFMAKFQGYQGVASIICMLIGANILRLFSWKKSALFTPTMIIITGGIFFSFIIFNKTFGLHLAMLFGTSPIAMAVFIGTLQNILSKATKYSLFDSTKEMAYIPLDKEMRTKGKAAVEVIGGRFGKSGGGIIQSTFFMLMPSYSFSDATPYFASIFFIVVLVWIFVVNALSVEYTKKVEENEQNKKSAS